MKEKKYITYCPIGPYPWAIIEYDGHHGFACDWGDCLEELKFIDGYFHKQGYIDYNDEKLTFYKIILYIDEPDSP